MTRESGGMFRPTGHFFGPFPSFFPALAFSFVLPFRPVPRGPGGPSLWGAGLRAPLAVGALPAAAPRTRPSRGVPGRSSGVPCPRRRRPKFSRPPRPSRPLDQTPGTGPGRASRRSRAAVRDRLRRPAAAGPSAASRAFPVREPPGSASSCRAGARCPSRYGGKPREPPGPPGSSRRPQQPQCVLPAPAPAVVARAPCPGQSRSRPPVATGRVPGRSLAAPASSACLLRSVLLLTTRPPPDLSTLPTPDHVPEPRAQAPTASTKQDPEEQVAPSAPDRSRPLSRNRADRGMNRRTRVCPGRLTLNARSRPSPWLYPLEDRSPCR